MPLLSQGHPVDWWFVFKFNAKAFPGCGGGATRACLFGGNVQSCDPAQNKCKYKVFSQQFVYGSNESPALQQGGQCIGDTTEDPVGGTFDQIYHGHYFYVVWNDQFYKHPRIQGCGAACGKKWGHSKGVVSWNNDGDGFVMQVTTPSWPASGSEEHPRADVGNTLGCIATNNNVKVSQHFFALKLNKSDLVKLLQALQNASVATDPANPQIVKNGGPADVQALVAALGKKSKSRSFTHETLSSGVALISKPAKLHVPPWQMVSAILGGASLNTATWWTRPEISATTMGQSIPCWDSSLSAPGAVGIATAGKWTDSTGLKTFGLTGGPGPDFNHAKLGVSTSGTYQYAIFGDLNQQGALSGKCGSSQNGRGGLFFVVRNSTLSQSISDLISAPPPQNAPVQ